jgi:hypothetical protein
MIENNEILLIIGNGFDLNLGLRTGYKDFILSSEFLSIKDNSLCNYLSNKFELNNWIDIERELKAYSHSVDTRNDSFKMDYNSLREKLTQYLTRISSCEINKNAYVVKLLSSLMQQPNGLRVISFNYTDSVERVANDLKPGGLSRDLVMKVHGSIQKNDIIFGVEDGFNKVKQQHIFVRKSFAKNYSDVSVHKYISTSPHTYFFGFSLGESDHSHFSEYFMHCCSTHITSKGLTFYHYGDEHYESLNMQIESLTNNQLGKFKRNIKPRFIDVQKEEVFK